MQFLKKLLPREDRFFDLFSDHARLTAKAARALRAGLSGESTAENFATVVSDEDKADLVTKEVLLAVRRSFITPFDRGAIKDLITAMDDSIDEMNKTVRAIELFGLEDFPVEMSRMAERILAASDLIVQAIGLLRTMGSSANEIIAICGQVVEIEGEADAIHRAGVKKLWDSRGAPNEIASGIETFFVGERILDRLEKVMDRLEDVADVVHGVVIEHV